MKISLFFANFASEYRECRFFISSLSHRLLNNKHQLIFQFMARAQLDSLDYKILSTLSSNGRKPYLEIARECGVSGAAIHQRIQKLTAMGVLKGSECLIDAASVGYDTCAYIGFFLKDPSKFDDVVERLRAIPEVVEVHFTTGQYDIFIKLYAHNNDHLLHLIHEELQGLGLARTESLISFKEVFKRQLPINPRKD
jgi:Lrp/AsnC family transcriptional regulator for asnA, asnC and gidA